MDVFIPAVGFLAVPKSPYVLLVDDEEDSYLPLVKLVQIAGYRSVAARSTLDALACCDHRRPDLVVTDLVMPGPDGRALARRIRSRFPGVPLFLVTGQNLENPKWIVPSDLFDAIFPKPLDFNRFISLVGDYISPETGRVPGRSRP